MINWCFIMVTLTLTLTLALTLILILLPMIINLSFRLSSVIVYGSYNIGNKFLLKYMVYFESA